jgi:hypothetical protein
MKKITYNQFAIIYAILSGTSVVLLCSKCTKIVGGRGSAPNPAGGAHDAPPDP